MDSSTTDEKAAGVALATPDKRTLFLLRSDKGDSPHTWAFPGGGIEKGESPEETITRELREETGLIVDEDSDPIKVTSHKGYLTFKQKVGNEQIPTLNDEHIAYAWAPLDNPPKPLHPGIEAVLDKLAKDMILGIVTTPNAGIPWAATAEGEDQSQPFNSTTDVTYPLFLDEYSFDNVEIDKEHDVDWISDMSRNCKIMYKDKDFPDEIQNNGKILKTDKPLKEHEEAECKAMHRMAKEFKEKHGKEPNDKERNEIYDECHEKFGLVAEKKWIEENNFDWKSWNAFTAGKLAHLEHKEDKNPPPDSDVEKYPDHDGGELMFAGDITIQDDKPNLSFDSDPFCRGKPLRHGLKLLIVPEPINCLDDILEIV